MAETIRVGVLYGGNRPAVVGRKTLEGLGVYQYQLHLEV